MIKKISTTEKQLDPKKLLESMSKNGVFGSALFDSVKAVFNCQHKATSELLPYPNMKGESKTRIVLKVYNRYGNTTLSVRSSFDGSTLTIDGSFVKWLTGQNIVGSEKLIDVCLLVFEKVCHHLKITPSPAEIEAIKKGEFRLLRLDYAVHCDAGSEKEAIFLQQAIKRCWAFRFPNYSHYRKFETLYTGQHDKRRSFKTYLKGREVKKYSSNLSLPSLGSELLKISQNIVRFEFTLRSQYLRDNDLSSPLHWTTSFARNFMRTEANKRLSKVFGNYPDTDQDQLKNLSNAQKLAVAAFKKNISIESIYEERAYKRLCDEILRKSGIDILLPCNRSNVSLRFTRASLLIKTKVRFRSHQKLFDYLVNIQWTN